MLDQEVARTFPTDPLITTERFGDAAAGRFGRNQAHPPWKFQTWKNATALHLSHAWVLSDIAITMHRLWALREEDVGALLQSMVDCGQHEPIGCAFKQSRWPDRRSLPAIVQHAQSEVS